MLKLIKSVYKYNSLKGPVWVTAKGTKILIKNLEDSHLLNIISMIYQSNHSKNALFRNTDSLGFDVNSDLYFVKKKVYINLCKEARKRNLSSKIKALEMQVINVVYGTDFESEITNEYYEY